MMVLDIYCNFEDLVYSELTKKFYQQDSHFFFELFAHKKLL